MAEECDVTMVGFQTTVSNGVVNRWDESWAAEYNFRRLLKRKTCQQRDRSHDYFVLLLIFYEI
jgi:hypothetical protein